MDGRYTKKSKQGRRDFAFSGLIACAQCGCAVVGEIKKERYVYYHCTGYADKCRGNPASCRRRYVREEVLEKQFTERMYVDKLDGLVDVAFFEKMSNQWRDEQDRCLRDIERHQEADKSYMDEGVQLLAVC
jgi:site-specific DNA recombinase